jgi:hypothetical protein
MCRRFGMCQGAFRQGFERCRAGGKVRACTFLCYSRGKKSSRISPACARRARLGGRAHTATLESTPVEMGCSWIHDYCDHHPIAQLAKGLGLNTVETDWDDIDIRIEGTLAASVACWIACRPLLNVFRRRLFGHLHTSSSRPSHFTSPSQERGEQFPTSSLTRARSSCGRC